IRPETCLPAIGQGAIGIECRKDDGFINNALAQLQDLDTWDAVVAERAFLGRLEGGCQVPIAAHAIVKDGGKKLRLAGLVGSVTGDRIIRDEMEAPVKEGARLGVELAESLLSRGADKILAEVYGRDLKGY
ncbi:MAG: hydroxymethylbilane synthase, partial [Nitrospirota bacterium]